jgi:septin family protein
MNILRHLDHVRPDALTAEQRTEWREYIMAPLREAKLRDYAAQLWSDAIDAEDYDKAQRIAAEIDTWFEPEAKR